MDINWGELHKKLSEPFPAEAVKRVRKTGGMFDVVTARTVMNRLDTVVGPGNWESRLSVIDAASGALKCSLTIHGVTREDCGDPNNPPKGEMRNGQIYKEAASDALKRAAVLFGVGRYLYEDDFEDDVRPIPIRERQGGNHHSRGEELKNLIEETAKREGVETWVVRNRIRAKLGIKLDAATKDISEEQVAAMVFELKK